MNFNSILVKLAEGQYVTSESRTPGAFVVLMTGSAGALNPNPFTELYPTANPASYLVTYNEQGEMVRWEPVALDKTAVDWVVV